MREVLRRPTVDLVTAACGRFDRENEIIERALKELFDQFPGNSDLSHVLLKVVALNRLYSTQILAVVDVAQQIHRNAQAIDSALAAGSSQIVDKIARVTLSVSGKERNNFSFATKYCSWHNPGAYPIWDSRVDKYLWTLQKQDHFAPFFKTNADLWDYPKFREVIIAFRDFYGLGSFTFKETDKFLWSEQGVPAPAGDITGGTD
jgi:hypothetical protein